MKIDATPFDRAAPFDFIGASHQDALKTMEFTRFFSADHHYISVISELISRGESDDLEFKSTFRWDLRQNKKNPAIEHASLKTMAAFMNSDGGDLLIGVEDNGNILGVESDGFPNDDKFLLHLWALIKDSMGQDVSPFIKTTLEKLDGKTVCRAHCLPNSRPVFLRQKGFDEAFYIRIGPSTGSLDISEALKYIAGRFTS
jgi:predicted HTH transcriptional regulator